MMASTRVVTAEGSRGEGGVDVDVVTRLSTRVERGDLVRDGVRDGKYRADREDGRWVLTPVDPQLHLGICGGIGIMDVQAGEAWRLHGDRDRETGLLVGGHR